MVKVVESFVQVKAPTQLYYMFRVIDVVVCGRNSDGGVLSNSCKS